MAATNGTEAHGAGAPSSELDVVVVGAGFAGLYLLHEMRRLGFSAVVVEAADDVGGTWYWNRYPGARCDIESIDYSYSWDPDLEREWQWSERYATQPEILRYLGHVADKHDLRRDIRFCTRVTSATWDAAGSRWSVGTDKGDTIRCKFYVMATGCLSVPKTPDVPGHERFKGPSYYTGRWPKGGVDFTGLRVGVIGTGSSGVQSIPIIAQQAKELTVFQRTPNYSRPAKNGPVDRAKKARFDADPRAYRAEARLSGSGVPVEKPTLRALQVPDADRLAKYEAAYQSGDLLIFGNAYADILVDEKANASVCEFLRGKIRSLVKDPQLADVLTPKDHFYGTKRPCIDTSYFETFNLPHVRLVDLRREPIETVTEHGIDTATRSFEFDVIVYATGFDAMTGAIVAVDVAGRDGLPLRKKWDHGPRTYLGLMTTGFPNFFTITGPGSPSVLSNMVVSIEQHVDWIRDCLVHMRVEHLDTVEPTPTAEDAWVQHVNDCADITLLPRANSWYMGANVPGKPRVFLPYIGGVDRYRKVCEDVVGRGWLGFAFDGRDGRRCNDGVVRRLQPDAEIFLEVLAELGAPRIETLSVADARKFAAATTVGRPTGPDVGEVRDGELAGAAGPLPYRMYRPATPGPHGIVAYFHGGGWVLGDLDSDDPFCRDLCAQGGVAVVSVNYRHAPEARFPAPADDAFAAVRWIAEHAAELGGAPGGIALCGWSAGANLAAVVCQLARDAGGPAIAGQVLVAPVTDCATEHPSYVENGEGYFLTAPLMRWFRDHYVDQADRTNPKASPLRAKSLAGLPPALVVTCEFDPLRDEGAAYADALAKAGVDVRHVNARGQIHSSITAVDIILSAAGTRTEIAHALRAYLGGSADRAKSRRDGAPAAHA